MHSPKDRACIVGIGQTPYRRAKVPDGTNLTLQLQASEAAIADAGLGNKDIDYVLPFSVRAQ